MESEIISENKTTYKKFVESHKDMVNKKNECHICGGSYTYFNKSRHFKTPKCLKVKLLRNL